MDRQEVVNHILAESSLIPRVDRAVAFAPANIALCKYWGKRDSILHLATNPSLSISLGAFGATTQIALSDTGYDTLCVNDQSIDADTPFAKRLRHFLDGFRPHPQCYFAVQTHSTIPIAAGLASSAAGFAALVQALDKFFGWNLSTKSLAILARLGSGSATRSLWQGFVEWPMGVRDDGMDSFGVPLDSVWPDLRIGLLIVDAGPKAQSSGVAMQQTVLTSPGYQSWTFEQARVLLDMKTAIAVHDFQRLGLLTERNAVDLHALMLSAHPPIVYSNAKTQEAIHQITAYRKEGLDIFFTQDAGPNLKLLFLEKDLERVKQCFPGLIVANPFAGITSGLPRAYGPRNDGEYNATTPPVIASVARQSSENSENSAISGLPRAYGPRNDGEYNASDHPPSFPRRRESSENSTASEPHVVLVDENDQVLGTAPKMQAHQQGLLHRAFSVFIYDKINDEYLFLLQQRHPDKYHCAGLWTNACCSHPLLEETVIQAAHRRLEEELSIHSTLRVVGKFQYEAHFDNGLSEHELDHILIGLYDSTKVIAYNTQEISALRWMSAKTILAEYHADPTCYTPWFETAFNIVLEALCYKC